MPTATARQNSPISANYLLVCLDNKSRLQRRTSARPQSSKKASSQSPPMTNGSRRVPTAAARWRSWSGCRHIATLHAGSTPRERPSRGSDRRCIVSAAPMRSRSLCAKRRFDPRTAHCHDAFTARDMPGRCQNTSNRAMCLRTQAVVYRAANASIPIGRGACRSDPCGPRFSSIRFMRGRVDRRRKRLASCSRPRINLQIHKIDFL